MRQGITKMIKLVALTRPYIIQESQKNILEGMHRTASCYCLLQGQFHLQKYPTLKEGPYMIRGYMLLTRHLQQTNKHI